MAGRVLLTLIGATGLIVGAFAEWVHHIRGTQLNVGALYRHTFVADHHLPVNVLPGPGVWLVLAGGLVAAIGGG